MTDHETFQAIADQVFAQLPQQFRDAAHNVVIQVIEWPPAETLAGFGIDSPYGLLGLYHGIGLPYKSVSDIPNTPDIVQLYRMPILAYTRETGERLEDVIAHVLIHEIGHHFGFSDDDMEAIEAGA